jgi:hypothetical protein
VNCQLNREFNFINNQVLTAKEISVEDMQKIVDANEKLVKELIDGNK